MGSFTWNIITPAIISLIVSLWAGRYFEEQRARRDHITRLFESVREDVRRAIEVGVDYFSRPPLERTPLQEAKVIAADREIRSSVTLLLYRSHSDRCRPSAEKAKEAFNDVIALLTGGTFQAKADYDERDHLISLVHSGASLRTALARLRDAELKDRFNSDPMVRCIKYCRDKLPTRKLP